MTVGNYQTIYVYRTRAFYVRKFPSPGHWQTVRPAARGRCLTRTRRFRDEEVVMGCVVDTVAGVGRSIRGGRARRTVSARMSSFIQTLWSKPTIAAPPSSLIISRNLHTQIDVRVAHGRVIEYVSRFTRRVVIASSRTRKTTGVRSDGFPPERNRTTRFYRFRRSPISGRPTFGSTNSPKQTARFSPADLYTNNDSRFINGGTVFRGQSISRADRSKPRNAKRTENRLRFKQRRRRVRANFRRLPSRVWN